MTQSDNSTFVHSQKRRFITSPTMIPPEHGVVGVMINYDNDENKSGSDTDGRVWLEFFVVET